MSKFGDLIRGVKAEPTPAPTPAPAPEPVVEEVVEEEAPTLEDMSKKELEEYGRTLGIELDRRHKKEDLIEELKEAEGE
jgi:hypothetical protein